MVIKLKRNLFSQFLFIILVLYGFPSSSLCLKYRNPMQDQSVENESQDYSIQLCDLCSQLVNRRKQMISQFVELCQNLQEMAKDQPKYKKCVHLMTSLFHLNDDNHQSHHGFCSEHLKTFCHKLKIQQINLNYESMLPLANEEEMDELAQFAPRERRKGGSKWSRYISPSYYRGFGSGGRGDAPTGGNLIILIVATPIIICLIIFICYKVRQEFI